VVISIGSKYQLHMDTKSVGDIREQAAILKAMKNGWAVLKPIGDRLAYDLVFDVCGRLVKVQVKTAWWYENKGVHYVDVRRTKTNRREMKRSLYEKGDFDFALAYVEELDVFYVFPFKVFVSYASNICLQVAAERQRKSKAETYLDAWKLIKAWAAPEETQEVESVKVGEAVDMVIPSQAAKAEGVET
jgi:hypothetical protein